MAKKRSIDAATRAEDADDALAFRDAVRDVKPLTQTTIAKGLDKPRAHRRIPAPGGAAGELAAAMPLIAPRMAAGGAYGDADGAPSSTGAAEALSFRRAGVRTQELRRLRRGLYPIEDELDLHGLGQIAARDNLAEFIAHNRDAGRRCVKIIHGKGYRSGARGPILKIAVDSWLRRHVDVMAFTSARPIDGGTGAVYVLLR
jgi:DNA-nicking Smr family endonuclease